VSPGKEFRHSARAGLVVCFFVGADDARRFLALFGMTFRR